MERTGVDVAFRPLESLKEALGAVDESGAQAVMDRWTVGATEVTGASGEEILDSSRLYVLLKSIVEADGLLGVSIDCVRYSFSGKSLLPHLCLAFSRLRDEGIAAPCEADVCAMLAELLLEGIAQKPPFLGNIGAVDSTASTADVLDCVGRYGWKDMRPSRSPTVFGTTMGRAEVWPRRSLPPPAGSHPGGLLERPSHLRPVAGNADRDGLGLLPEQGANQNPGC